MHQDYRSTRGTPRMNATYSIYEDDDYRLEVSAPDLFRSPLSTASSVSLGRDLGAARKRARSDYFDRNAWDNSSTSHTPQWPNPFAAPTASANFAQPSPSPFVNTRYQLARGLDTPNELASSLNQGDPDDTHWRSTWHRPPSEEHTDLAQGAGPLSREHNGRKRGRAPLDNQLGETWGQYVFRMAGGFARGAWDFCKDTAFRGFSAGGGTAYDMSQEQPIEFDPSQSWCHIDTDGIQSNRDSTPVPGDYPQEDFYDAVEAYTEDRPAKRLQTGHGDDWVFVDQESRTSVNCKPRRPTLSRIVSGRRPRPSMPRTTSVNHAGSPVAPERSRAASFASARSPQASPSQSHSRNNSSNDGQKWSARRQRENRQADASMSRLNKQLQAMIREGKEALATRVEIEVGRRYEDFKDEGFGEGNWDDYSQLATPFHGKRYD